MRMTALCEIKKKNKKNL